jgi:hypothetical protein
MQHAVIDRFRVLEAAFRARCPRSERAYARFAALAALSAPQDVETLIERCFEMRRDLDDGLGAWRAPSRPLRLVFAAALASLGRRPADFFTARAALNAERKRRGGRALSQGSACAAFALVAAGGYPHQVGDVYDLIESIAAPWWRRVAAREEILAATFAALGETPEDAARRLIAARDALVTAGAPRSHAEAASYEVALVQIDPGAVAAAWTALNTAVRAHPGLRSGLGKTGLAVLATHGDGPRAAQDLRQGYDVASALQPRPGGKQAARLALRLAQAHMGGGGAIGAAQDLSVLLAGQAAMTASIAASSAAVAAAAAAS